MKPLSGVKTSKSNMGVCKYLGLDDTDTNTDTE